MKFQVCQEHRRPHTLVLVFIAAPPSWAGFRTDNMIVPETVCLFAMYKHVDSTKQSHKSTADTFGLHVFPLFPARAHWFVCGMFGWKQSSGRCGRTTYLLTSGCNDFVINLRVTAFTELFCPTVMQSYCTVPSGLKRKNLKI